VRTTKKGTYPTEDRLYWRSEGKEGEGEGWDKGAETGGEWKGEKMVKGGGRGKGSMPGVKNLHLRRPPLVY